MAAGNIFPLALYLFLLTFERFKEQIYGVGSLLSRSGGGQITRPAERGSDNLTAFIVKRLSNRTPALLRKDPKIFIALTGTSG